MANTADIRISTYQLVASNGRPIRKATRVTLPDGEVIDFTERMTRREVEAWLERRDQRNALATAMAVWNCIEFMAGQR